MMALAADQINAETISETLTVSDNNAVAHTSNQKASVRSEAQLISSFPLASVLIYLLATVGSISSVFLFLADTVRFPLWVLFISVVMFLTVAALHYLQSRKLVARSMKNQFELKKQLEKLHDHNWELQESEERYRGLAEAFGDMILHRDANGKITYVNEAVTKAFDKDKFFFLGKDFNPNIIEEIHQTGHDYPAIIREMKIRLANGNKWLAWFDLPMRDEVTGETSIRSVARDITKQKETEIKLRAASTKAQAASEAKSRFLANVSHEMRTPLNGILGMSGLLADTKLSAEQEAYIDAVHNSGTALLSLIEDILDMSLVEAGKITLKSEPVKPVRLLEDVCELLSSRAHEKGITISSFISNSVPPVVETDTGRLRQVLINLIGNAIKFTEEGGIYVEFSAKPINDGTTTRLKFSVHDTGPGISKTHQSLIFDEFSQSDSENTRKHGGAGLGLTISQRIIKAMGGRIAVESEKGLGSKFSFQIDLNVLEPVAIGEAGILAEKTILMVGLPGFQETAISNYILDQSGSFETYNDLKAVSQNISYDSVLVKHVSALGAKALVEKLKAAKIELSKTIVLIEPEERSDLTLYKEYGVEAYLIEPVRSNSLIRILLDKRAGDTNDVQQSDARKWAASLWQTSQPKHVLLAEDNDINAMLVETILKKAGHTVSRAMNGQEALNLWKNADENSAFDLVLMDLQMPVMDGLDCLRTIRQQEQHDALSPVPIYILTADEQPETREKSEKYQASGFLTKPLDPDLLLKTIADI